MLALRHRACSRICQRCFSGASPNRVVQAPRRQKQRLYAAPDDRSGASSSSSSSRKIGQDVKTPVGQQPDGQQQQQQQGDREANGNGSIGSSSSEEGSSKDDSFNTWAAQLAAQVFASPLFYLVSGLALIKLVASTGEQSLSIFVFAALPVTLLTLLSKSDLGKQVQKQLEERLPDLDSKAAAVRAQHVEAKQRNPWYGPARPRFPGPLGAAEHLQGQQAGDYGFDPLGLGREPAAFARNLEAELVHARWAMLAAIGCLVPEVLSMRGVELGEPVWWKVGAAKLRDDLTLNWGGIQGFRIAGKQGIGIIIACQLVLMGGPEYARYVGIRSLEPVGVHLPGDQVYPGGAPFDPLNYANDADGFVDQSVKEIKNGRLAMVAMLGYFVQAAVTRQGPVQNLVDFIQDPVHNNIFKYL